MAALPAQQGQEPRPTGMGGGQPRGWDDRGWGDLSAVERAKASLRRLSKKKGIDTETPIRNLDLFTKRFRKDRLFDGDRLDNAISQMASMADSPHLPEKDRKGLAADVERLRKLRATNGDFSRWQ